MEEGLIIAAPEGVMRCEPPRFIIFKDAMNLSGCMLPAESQQIQHFQLSQALL